MIEKQVKITNRLGLHARAAASVVKTAARFKSVIRLERRDGTGAADAKSILSVLMLAAARGTELVISSEGSDEEQAADALCELFEDGFGECER